MRNISDKCSLPAIMVALRLTTQSHRATTSRIEVMLQQVQVIANAEATKSDRNHEAIREHFNHYGEQFQSLLSRSIESTPTIGEASGQIAEFSVEATIADQATSADGFDTEGVKAFHSNGSIVFE